MVVPARGAAYLAAYAVTMAGACGRVGFEDTPRDGSAPPDVDLDSGLIAYYAMDDDPAQGARDTSGHHLDGACTSGCPPRTPGHTGTAARFDGTAWYTVADGPLLHPAAFTITLWMRSAQTSGTLLAKPQRVGAGASFEILSRVAVTAFCTDADPGPAGELCLDARGVPAMTWAFIAVTFDGATKTLQIDDDPVNTQAATMVYDTSPLVIGADFQDNAVNFPFQGDLDEIRIYDRVLDADRIAAVRGL